ncbi:astacin-like metalloprotease toxin 5 [Haemaphysalis longicornis]
MAFSPASIVPVLFLASTLWKASQTAPVTQASTCWPHPGNLALERPGLFEGDIVLPVNSSEDRTVVTSDVSLWPGAIIPFVVESSLGRYTKMIREAMDEIQKRTCLRFVARTAQFDYVTIYRGSGCYSAIGRQRGVQPVSLGSGCLYKGTVVHELLHAAGFYHEHSRSDRDQYIDVYTENAQPDSVKQFEKLEPWQNRLLSPFDRDSVMLYGSHAFARAPGLVTMQAKDGGRLVEVYDKTGLSISDVRRIKTLYHCR